MVGILNKNQMGYCLWLACWIQLLGVGQSSSCPTFGTDQSSRLSRSREDKTFLNFESPAQCRGNVTGWRFCYYRNVDSGRDIDDISRSQKFSALFMVYRRPSATSNNYISVPDSVREKTIEWRFIRESSFQCTDEILSPNEYFEIQKNDVVGACIKDIGSIESLLLVGTSSGNYLTYQWDRSGYDDCSFFQYRIIDTSHKDFRLRSTSTLHLYANIAAFASCTAGSNIAAADAVTSGLSGTYLNVESPVSCNNHIIQWHYCYYPQAATPGSTLSMTVAVWSLDVATNTYIVNPNSIKTITIQPVQTLAKILCVEESLSEAEYVTVFSGDVIGVSLPSSVGIPILGSNANPSLTLQRHSQSRFPSDYRINDLSQLTSHVLHLYATIDHLETEMSTTTMKPSTDRTNQLFSTEERSTDSTDILKANLTNYKTTHNVQINYKKAYTIAAPVGGVILTIVLLSLVIGCIMIYKRYKRKRISEFNPPTAYNNHYNDEVSLEGTKEEFEYIYLSPNVAYHSGNKHKSKPPSDLVEPQENRNQVMFSINKSCESIPYEEYDYVRRYE